MAIINNLVYKLRQCKISTGTAVYSKFKASTGTSNIKAKADNTKIPGLFVDTIIVNQLHSF